MLKPLQLGNQQFPVNIIQGPLAGISCAPFRLLTSRLSKPAFTCTEMISCKTLLHKPLFAQQRFISKDPAEGPVSFQLSGSAPYEIAKATKIVTDYGADLIDLNCGCPVNKIRRKGAGSSLLTATDKLYQLIYAMKRNTHLPVSVKIRVEGDSAEKFNQEVAKIVSEAGADFLIVHGRHWTEHYETACRYNQIAFFVEAMKIPVIGNGDIKDIDSLKQMFATGCAGVMIGRAGVGQPWLIGKLIAEMQNQPFRIPSPKDIGDLFLEHVTALISLIGNEKFALLQARKFAKYYARPLAERAAFVDTMNTIDSLSSCRKIILEWFY